MVKFFLPLFAVVYIGSIVSCVSKIKQVNKCLSLLASFINSGKYSAYGQIIKNDDFDQNLSEVLFHYPVIQRFCNFYSCSLSYGESPVKNYNSSIELYNQLRMKYNYLFDDLCRAFNPLNALKKIVVFPSLILEFFGFHPTLHASRFLNLLGWILTYLLGLYQNEIKALISSLLKHF